MELFVCAPFVGINAEIGSTSAAVAAQRRQSPQQHQYKWSCYVGISDSNEKTEDPNVDDDYDDDHDNRRQIEMNVTE